MPVKWTKPAYAAEPLRRGKPKKAPVAAEAGGDKPAPKGKGKKPADAKAMAGKEAK